MTDTAPLNAKPPVDFKQLSALAHFAWDLAEDADPQIREAIQAMIEIIDAARKPA